MAGWDSVRVSRRDFLGSAGAAAVAATGTASGGVSRREASRSPPQPGSKDVKVRMAVVGGGFGARFHWHEHPQCAVTAVTDLRADRRQALVDHYGCRQVYSSMEEMLKTARDSFDAVAIFTEAPNHARHALVCFEAGKHVVSACPVATSLEDLRRIKEAKERTGLRYMMAESSYYRQECIAARELFRKGEFGRLVYSEVEYYHPGIGGRRDGLSWYNGRRTWRHGYPPMLYPTHSLGLLVGVTRERIVKVSCQGQLVGDFPAGKENAYDNPFNNEMALGRTNQDNTCRFGVFWQVAASGERAQWLGEKMSCYMASSAYSAGPIWAIFDADAVKREGWKVTPPYVDPDGYFFSGNTLAELAAAIHNEYQAKPMKGETLRRPWINTTHSSTPVRTATSASRRRSSKFKRRLFMPHGRRPMCMTPGRD